MPLFLSHQMLSQEPRAPLNEPWRMLTRILQYAGIETGVFWDGWAVARIASGIRAASALLVALVLLSGCDRPGALKAFATKGPPPAKPARSVAPTPPPPKEPASPWRLLARDGLHDVENLSLALLQEPAEALSVLPPAQEGNFVDWVAALRDGYISPRTNIHPETKIRVIDLDVLMTDTAAMPVVRFPHRPHTEWLDCSNCHDKIFVAQRGANPVTMYKILQGEYCGQCHGAVSFPLTQCRRCHSVPRDQVTKVAPR